MKSGAESAESRRSSRPTLRGASPGHLVSERRSPYSISSSEVVPHSHGPLLASDLAASAATAAVNV